jgi:hypothetical protein
MANELEPVSNTLSIVSLVSGILGLVSWGAAIALWCIGLGWFVLPVTFILGVVAAITGRMGHKAASERGESDGMALGGLIMGVLNTLGALGGMALFCGGILLYGGLVAAQL